MKSLQLLFLLYCGGSASAQHSQAAPIMRDVATHQQLAQKLGQVRQQDPMSKMVVSNGEDPSVSAGPQDLISQSDIICYRGYATLVPKHALLSAPANLKDRLMMSAGARLVSWSEFYAANRGWITTEEVNFDQAQGKQPLPEAVENRLAKSVNLVVATYLGGPISVMPPVISKPASVVQK